MVPFKCDVHGWMNAYVGVLDHPYFAVTDEDGKFELKRCRPAPTRSKRGTRSSARRHRASRSARRKRRKSTSRSTRRQRRRTKPGRQGRKAAGGAGSLPRDSSRPSGLSRPSCPERCSTGSPVRRRLHGPAGPGRQPRHQHRFGPRRCPTGRRLRLEHVHVPAVEVGGRNLLRARPPADRQHGRLSHHHPRRLAVARRPAPLAEAARRRGARAVIVQGVLGGLTVLFFLPDAVSTAHAGLAEIFFCLTVAIALFTSPRLDANRLTRGRRSARCARSRRRTTALVYIQILIGATMRHTDAGLAIPDFPLMFGGIVPDHWNAKIAIHFAHRVGALVVAAAIAATSAHIWSHHRGRRGLTRPALLLVALVVVQVTLGALTVLSRRDVGSTASTSSAARWCWRRRWCITLRAGGRSSLSVGAMARTTVAIRLQPDVSEHSRERRRPPRELGTCSERGGRREERADRRRLRRRSRRRPPRRRLRRAHQAAAERPGRRDERGRLLPRRADRARADADGARRSPAPRWSPAAPRC